MAFQTGHRRGQVYDVQTLNKIIHNTCFNLTGKSEREFELAFMNSVNATLTESTVRSCPRWTRTRPFAAFTSLVRSTGPPHDQ